jgi:Icc-related predicted phosphoesterase
MTILDFANGEHLGCADLWKRVQDIAPRVHAFGHIHEGSGDEERDGTIYVNASICDGAYRPVNPCRVIDI